MESGMSRNPPNVNRTGRSIRRIDPTWHDCGPSLRRTFPIGNRRLRPAGPLLLAATGRFTAPAQFCLCGGADFERHELDSALWSIVVRKKVAVQVHFTV